MEGDELAIFMKHPLRACELESGRETNIMGIGEANSIFTASIILYKRALLSVNNID